MVVVHLQQKITNEVIQKCMCFLKENGGADIALGKHFMENSDIYVNVSEYTSHQLEDSGWEAHKKYADLQVVLAGEEQILVANIEKMHLGDYREDSDYLACSGDSEVAVKVDRDTCVLLFPEDGHMPGVCIARQPVKVKKAVFKIPVHHFA